MGILVIMTLSNSAVAAMTVLATMFVRQCHLHIITYPLTLWMPMLGHEVWEFGNSIQHIWRVTGWVTFLYFFLRTFYWVILFVFSAGDDTSKMEKENKKNWWHPWVTQNSGTLPVFTKKRPIYLVFPLKRIFLLFNLSSLVCLMFML